MSEIANEIGDGCSNDDGLHNFEYNKADDTSYCTDCGEEE